MSKKAVVRKQETAIEAERKLRPGSPILMWTDSVTGNLEPFPGFLSRKMPSGRWSVVYFQRAMATLATEAEFSEMPKLHHWTFPEAYDEWDSMRSGG